MRKKSEILTTLVLVIVFIVGLSVMLYPTFANWWNGRAQSRAIASYTEAVANLSDEEYQAILEQASAYNEELASLAAPLADYNTIEGYEDTLDVTGTGIMGYVTIPSIQVQLPVYHGTSDSVLAVGAGHLQGSTLPIGGVGRHAVLSGHRGLASSRLFTDLDKIVEGDTFTVTVLDEVYTYEVEQILIIEPSEVEYLAIIEESDYVTLMTCTPYGINSHRLLIRGKRLQAEFEAEEAGITTTRVSADCVQVDEMVSVPFICTPLLAILLLYWFGGSNHRHFDDDEQLESYVKKNLYEEA